MVMHTEVKWKKILLDFEMTIIQKPEWQKKKKKKKEKKRKEKKRKEKISYSYLY